MLRGVCCVACVCVVLRFPDGVCFGVPLSDAVDFVANSEMHQKITEGRKKITLKKHTQSHIQNKKRITYKRNQ